MTINRRNFLKAAAVAGAVAALPRMARAAEVGVVFKTQLHKALIAPVADDATCERITKAGFHGVELSDKKVTIEQAIQGRLTAEKHGLKIHSFMGGWADFNNPDADARRKSIDDVKQMIRLTTAYGASTILLVPCRVGGMAMPRPSQFKIAFDPATLAVTSVADGDNAPFAAYIEAQNKATELSRQAVEELIPVAAREGVIIALENVWNNLWVQPPFAAAFVRSFDVPWVKAYFDLGNHVRYAPVEEWLRTLNHSIAKMHIKDFKIDREKKNDGDFVPIGKGSIDWISVRKAIDEAGYNGWVSIESGGYTDAEHSALIDRIFAGQGA